MRKAGTLVRGPGDGVSVTDAGMVYTFRFEGKPYTYRRLQKAGYTHLLEYDGPLWVHPEQGKKEASTI